jgi:acetyl-CoA acyltransferase
LVKHQRSFRFKRPDELAAETIEFMMNELPDFDKTRIDDVMVGNAMPEAEQGLNVARLISLMGLKVEDVPGNCKPLLCIGLETLVWLQPRFNQEWHTVLLQVVQSMSFIPMGGYKQLGLCCAKAGNEDYYWGMGLTAEAVAQQFKVSREDQDELPITRI